MQAPKERGWSLVLPDPDEPVLHLYAEGTSDEASADLARELASVVESVVEGEEIGPPAGNREPEFSS
jgi:phosphomannomutase